VILLDLLEDTTMRRDTIGLLVSLTLGLLVAPLVAEPQPQQMSRVGLVSLGGDPQWWQPFLEAMACSAMSKAAISR
jgi:uncharacterized membrane protein